MGKAGYYGGDRPQKARTTFRSHHRRFKAGGRVRGYVHTGKAFKRKLVVPNKTLKRNPRFAPQPAAMVQLVRAAAYVDQVDGLRAPANLFDPRKKAIAARRAAAYRRKHGLPPKSFTLKRAVTKKKKKGRR
jgi:hypothetical protein